MVFAVGGGNFLLESFTEPLNVTLLGENSFSRADGWASLFVTNQRFSPVSLLVASEGCSYSSNVDVVNLPPFCSRQVEVPISAPSLKNGDGKVTLRLSGRRNGEPFIVEKSYNAKK